MTCRHATHGSSQSKGDGIELLPDVSGQHAEKAELILIALVGHAKPSGALFPAHINSKDIFKSPLKARHV